MNRTRSWQHLGPNEISRMSLIVKIAALTGLLVHACHSSGTKVSIKENSEANLSSDSQRSLTSHYHFLSSSRLATYPNLTSKNRVSVPTINNKNRLLGNTIIKNALIPVASLTTPISVGEPSPDLSNTHDTIRV